MNSYDVYQPTNIQSNRIHPNNSRLNYVYNRANQNIDHLRDFHSNSNDINPIRINKNIYRNESNEISSILNNDPYHINKRFNELNSSNNYNSTNYSSFQSNNNDNYNQNQNQIPNNNIIDMNNLRSQYSNFYNRNNNNYNEMNSYRGNKMYPRISNNNFHRIFNHTHRNRRLTF